MKRTHVLALAVGVFSTAAAVAAAAQIPASTPAPIPAAPIGQPQMIANKTIDLGAAFPDAAAAKGRTFHARHVALAPGQEFTTGGAVGRPGIGYVTIGELVERRTDGALRTLGVGGTSFDPGGEVAAFVNDGRTEAVLLYVDLVPAQGR